MSSQAHPVGAPTSSLDSFIFETSGGGGLGGYPIVRSAQDSNIFQSLSANQRKLAWLHDGRLFVLQLSGDANPKFEVVLSTSDSETIPKAESSGSSGASGCWVGVSPSGKHVALRVGDAICFFRPLSQTYIPSKLEGTPQSASSSSSSPSTILVEVCRTKTAEISHVHWHPSETFDALSIISHASLMIVHPDRDETTLVELSTTVHRSSWSTDGRLFVGGSRDQIVVVKFETEGAWNKYTETKVLTPLGGGQASFRCFGVDHSHIYAAVERVQLTNSEPSSSSSSSPNQLLGDVDNDAPDEFPGIGNLLAHRMRPSIMAPLQQPVYQLLKWNLQNVEANDASLIVSEHPAALSTTHPIDFIVPCNNETALLVGGHSAPHILIIQTPEFTLTDKLDVREAASSTIQQQSQRVETRGLQYVGNGKVLALVATTQPKPNRSPEDELVSLSLGISKASSNLPRSLSVLTWEPECLRTHKVTKGNTIQAGDSRRAIIEVVASHAAETNGALAYVRTELASVQPTATSVTQLGDGTAAEGRASAPSGGDGVVAKRLDEMDDRIQRVEASQQQILEMLIAIKNSLK